jgi:two-component system, OmpR family, alkaline phosphatase synthesis response regulator PhoP
MAYYESEILMTKRILIVDDEAHVRFLLEQTLEDFEDYGVEIDSTSNGEEALKRIEEEQPDLMFLDVMMPRINGFEVCSRIKSCEETRKITIILLTAKGQEIDRQRGEEVGADLYLTKPFDPDEIVSVTSKFLKIELEE